MPKRLSEQQIIFLAMFASPIKADRIREEVRHMVTGDYPVDAKSLLAMLAAPVKQARIAVFLAFAGVWGMSFPAARALYKQLSPEEQQQLDALLDVEISDARKLWSL